MTNYKKSLLSLAAVIALGTGANAANSYLPLASDAVDNKWTMFGVDGFISSDGATASTEFDTTGGWTQTTDQSTDDVPTPMQDTGANGDLLEVKALPNATDILNPVIINMDRTNLVFSETEPVRSMYVKVGNDTEANLYLRYKASLEGETVEVQFDGVTDTTYEFTISALNTYSNPAPVTEKEGGDDVNATKLTAVADLMDWDFTNNPSSAVDYSDAYRETTDDVPAANVRMYEYDALNTNWLVYDTGSAGVSGANDFTDLKRAKAYWGKANLDATHDGTNTPETGAGMTLGTGEIVDTDYDAELDGGWNMISFDSTNPTIRTSMTGLVLTVPVAGAATTFDIVDATGTNSITLDGTGLASEDVSIAINLAVEQAKARGDIPHTFNLRAFAAGGTTVVMVSNKRFSVIDAGSDNFTTAVSLAGQNVWDIAADQLDDFSGAASFPAGGVSSVYGEYAMVLEPLVAADTAAAMTDGDADAVHPAAILVNTDTDEMVFLDAAAAADSPTVGETVTNLTAALEAQTDVGAGFALATAIDFTNGGVAENHIIAASVEPFFIRDHTFTRVFTWSDDVANRANAINTNGALTPTSYTDDFADATSTNIVGKINTSSDTSGVFADDLTGAVADFVVVSASVGAQNFNLSDNFEENYLADGTNTDDIAKGAVKNVWTIDDLAKRPVYTHLVEVGLTQVEIETADDGGAGAFNTIVNGTTIVYGAPADTSTAPLKEAFLDDLVDEIQAQAVTLGLDVVVSHDFNQTVPADATITAEGYGVSALTVTIDAAANVGVEGNADFGKIISANGTLQDLRYNAFHTNDFAKDGPLYTLKDQNWTASAIITGTADFNTYAAGITWDSLDLTKSVDTWFDDRDYNLFSIDGKAGYWVYLVADSSTSGITITKKELVPTYTHHFDGTTVTNNVSAALTVYAAGLPTTSPVTSTVYASVEGTNVDLTGDPTTSTEWTATINSYEITDLRDSTTNITISASTGLGKSELTVDVNATIDLTAPQAPIVDVGAGGSAFSIEANATDSDVEGFYVFDTFVPDEDVYDANVSGTSQFVGALPAEGGSLDFCASDVITFGTSKTLLAMAVDGDGTFGTGNVSDMTEFEFAPFLKSSNVLYHIGTTTTPSLISTAFGTDCAVTGVVEEDDNGMSLRSVSTNVVSYIAYAKVDGVTFGMDIPFTIYLDNDAGETVEIKYSAEYAGKAVYVEIEGEVYSWVLPADDSVLGTAATAGNIEAAADGAAALSGNVPENVTNQTFPVL